MPSARKGDASELSAQYETPMGVEHGTMEGLKERIATHYNLASDYYLSLWGEHIHHGYWPTEESKRTESKEQAQLNLVNLLLRISSTSATTPTPTTTTTTTTASPTTAPPPALRVLDVGCGLGGTSRHLATTLGATVTGITISAKQVEMATRLSLPPSPAAATTPGDNGALAARDAEGYIPFGPGRVRFLELDAEKMAGAPELGGGEGGEGVGGFDVVWISEALSHVPGKEAFFRNAYGVLREGGRLVIADWFKGEGVGEGDGDIKAIEDGMLLPPLHTQQGYLDLAQQAGFSVLGGPLDISKDVAKTWDITWSLIQKPALWAFALSQGRDGIAFLQAFRAMRRGYANGGFRYGVMAFVKGSES